MRMRYIKCTRHRVRFDSNLKIICRKFHRKLIPCPYLYYTVHLHAAHTQHSQRWTWWIFNCQVKWKLIKFHANVKQRKITVVFFLSASTITTINSLAFFSVCLLLLAFFLFFFSFLMRKVTLFYTHIHSLPFSRWGDQKRKLHYEFDAQPKYAYHIYIPFGIWW